MTANAAVMPPCEICGRDVMQVRMIRVGGKWGHGGCLAWYWHQEWERVVAELSGRSAYLTASTPSTEKEKA